jgi:hypothetical protein
MAGQLTGVRALMSHGPPSPQRHPRTWSSDGVETGWRSGQAGIFNLWGGGGRVSCRQQAQGPLPVLSAPTARPSGSLLPRDGRPILTAKLTSAPSSASPTIKAARSSGPDRRGSLPTHTRVRAAPPGAARPRRKRTKARPMKYAAAGVSVTTCEGSAAVRWGGRARDRSRPACPHQKGTSTGNRGGVDGRMCAGGPHPAGRRREYRCRFAGA